MSRVVHGALAALLLCCAEGSASRRLPQESAPAFPAPLPPSSAAPEPGLSSGSNPRPPSATATCSNGAKTSVSGVIYDPAGVTPLYNVLVYAPSEPLPPMEEGVSCQRCATRLAGNPRAATITDLAGRFVLSDVASGDDVPVVVQLGKWRRSFTVPHVEPCQDNPITDRNRTRLPRTKAEGHMPRIAVSTGVSILECTMRNFGIDESEFTAPSGDGRVNLFIGDGGAGTVVDPTPQAELWRSLDSLKRYDMIILLSETSYNLGEKQPPAPQLMHDYASAGGRILAFGYQHYWLQSGPVDFQAAVQWSAPHWDANGPTFLVDQSFPKGKALAEWLVNAGASTTRGSIDIATSGTSVKSILTPQVQSWVTSNDGSRVKLLSFNAPFYALAEDQCGRVVYGDFDASGVNTGARPFPGECLGTSTLAAEKLFEFLFFDLSGCIQKDADVPSVPPIK